MFCQSNLDKLTKALHQSQIKDIRYHILLKEAHTLSLYENTVDNSRISSESLICAEGNYNGFLGTVYIENPAEENFHEFIEIIKNTAMYNNKVYIPTDFTLDLSSERSCIFPSDREILKDMQEAEKQIYALDEKITGLREFKCIKTLETVVLQDDKGNSLINSSGYFFQAIDLIMAQSSVSKNAYCCKITQAYDKNIFLSIAKEAAFETSVLLNSIVPQSGEYPIILKNTVFAEILSVAMPIFYLDNMQKGLSPLKDRVNIPLFSSLFTLYESPASEKGLVYRTFDDEGSPTAEKTIVERGFFKLPLSNKAAVLSKNQNSSGNGFKPAIKDSTATGVTNIFVSEGSYKLSELIKKMDNGILINSIQGLHAGINTLTGDISLLSTGFIIEHGKIVSGAEQITIAANLFDLLNQIVILGNDTASTSFSSMANLSYVNAPSVLIRKMNVAGK